MKIEKCIKPSFTVIGKEGSTSDGVGFVQRLWENANSHFSEIQNLAKRNADGELCGVWGAMSDFSHCSGRGKIISVRACTLPEQNALMMLKRRRAGRNG